MPQVYSWRFHVRSYEMDGSGFARPTAYLNYIEEGAVQASASLGFDYAWYQANQRTWVARKLMIRFYAPVTYGDDLELFTWISDIRRVQSHREYDLRRVSDGLPILRARTNWVYLDSTTMRPTRIPDEFTKVFGENSPLDDLDTGLVEPIPIEDPVIHTEERRVQHAELDPTGHVNNSFYIGWVEQSLTNALRTAGWPPERFASSDSDFKMYPLSHQIEYFRSALDDEPIWIVTRLNEIGYDRAAWHHEIRHGATGELIAKDVTVRTFADAHGPRSIPDALHIALIQRARS